MALLEGDPEDLADHALGLVRTEPANEIAVQHRRVAVEDRPEQHGRVERRRDHRGVRLVLHASIFPAAAVGFAVASAIHGFEPLGAAAVVGGAVVGGAVVGGAVVTGRLGMVAAGIVSLGAGAVVLVVVAPRRTVVDVDDCGDDRARRAHRWGAGTVVDAR